MSFLKSNSKLLKRYGAYLVRWQLSTPILAPIVSVVKSCSSLGGFHNAITFFTNHPNALFGTKEDWIGAIIANLIGGLIFFWVDRIIFYHKIDRPVWEVKENIKCVDCGETVARGYRLVQALNYDKSDDPNPEFRCERCSDAKYKQMNLK